MKRATTFLSILGLAGATLAVFFLLQGSTGRLPGILPAGPVSGPVQTGHAGGLTVTGQLTQEKVFGPGPQTVGYMLTITADQVETRKDDSAPGVDMVIVLDRSGSMGGAKMAEAKKAVQELLESLDKKDRFALVSYSSGVTIHSELSPATRAFCRTMESVVSSVQAAGGTNLGAGLARGMELIQSAAPKGNRGRVILISDGQANEGVTDPGELSAMASGAVAGEFAISTVGVGADFNEWLMTAVADAGVGSYYFMESAQSFAAVFLNEFSRARAVAASGVSVQVMLDQGVDVVSASGYPVARGRHMATVNLPDMLSNQTKKIFLTFQIPESGRAEFVLPAPRVEHKFNGKSYAAACPEPIRIARARSESEALASIFQPAWEEKVLKDDFNDLKTRVAKDIREGRKAEAKEKIDAYRRTKAQANALVMSPAVEANLMDCEELDAQVEETFAGGAAQVARKQNAVSKAMQYESYGSQRAAHTTSVTAGQK